MIDLATARADLAEKALQARQERAASLLDDPSALERLAAEAGAVAALEAADDAQALVIERERDAAQAAEVERKRSLGTRIWTAAARRTAAIEKAQLALGDLIDGLAEGEAARQSMAQLASAIPVALPPALMASEATLTASRFIAAALARLGSESRYGGITFPMGLTLGATGSWAKADARVVERFAASITTEVVLEHE